MEWSLLMNFVAPPLVPMTLAEGTSSSVVTDCKLTHYRGENRRRYLAMFAGTVRWR